MATKKKGRTSNSKKNHTQPQKNVASRQLKAVVLFAVSLFFLCVVFIKGENYWLDLHNFFFGAFGVMTFFYPILLCVITVLYAIDKIKGTAGAKIIETSILAMLVGAAVDIFT